METTPLALPKKKTARRHVPPILNTFIQRAEARRPESSCGFPIRQPEGFTFFMGVQRTIQLVRVFVDDEALNGKGSPGDLRLLRAQFEAERAELEDIARQRYEQGRITTDGLISLLYVTC